MSVTKYLRYQYGITQKTPLLLYMCVTPTNNWF